MSNKSLNIFTVVIICCILVLLIVNYMPTTVKAVEDPFLTNNGVKGVEIFHDNLPYTLNFDQQNFLIDVLNRSERIGDELIKKDVTQIPFTKIIVYQFEKPSVILTPVTLVEKNLIFAVPDWNPNGYIKENSGGDLLKMLSLTFDS